MKTNLLFDIDALSKIKSGVEKISKAVSSTLGPKGRSCIFSKQYGGVTISKDGITVARAVHLQDEAENIAAQVIREASSKTNDSVGDGTSTAVVLANFLVQEGIKNVIAGGDPLAIRRGFDKATAVVIKFIDEKITKPVTGERVRQIASVSANDPEIGNVIADAVEAVGADGVLTVSESQTSFGITKEIVNGTRFDRGFVSPVMATSERGDATIEDALILITDLKLNSAEAAMPLLEQVAREGKKDLLIIADEIGGGLLTTLIVNRMRGTFFPVAVRAPYYGDLKKETLRDLAILTGGRFISEDAGDKLESVKLSDLGRAGKVIVNKDTTTIVDGKGDVGKINERATIVRAEVAATESDFEKQGLKGRLGRLLGKVGVIKIGAATEAELKERKDRVEDALNATTAAMLGGSVPGGGVALIRAAKNLALLLLNEVTVDEMLGVKILEKALFEPARKLAENSGKNGDVVLNEIEKGSGGYGYNSLTGVYEDLEAAGIIDPARVTKSALQNATSAAGTLLTCNTLLVPIPEKEPDLAQMPQM